MDSYASLVDGYKDFRGDYLAEKSEAIEICTSKGRSPKTLVIGCTDCEVNPCDITHADLGEILSVSSVANIVPPYKEGGLEHVSLGATIQFALEYYHVEHVIVMGHSGCRGVAELMAEKDKGSCETDGNCMSDWVSILQPAKEAVRIYGHDLPEDEQLRLCEMESTLVSIQNLASYPFVREAVRKKNLTLHAWYLHAESGELLSYRPEEGRFRRLIQPQQPTGRKRF